MKSIEEIKPTPITVTDKKEIRKDIYYSSFKTGLFWISIISFIFLALFFLTHTFSYGFIIELRDVAVVFSAGIVAVTCFYNAQSLRLNIEAHEKKLKFDYEKFELEQEQKIQDSLTKKAFERKIYAYEICKYVVTPEMTIHLQRARMFFLKDPLFEEIKSIPSTNDTMLKEWSHKFDLCPARRSVILVLNYFEQLAIAIEQGFADEEVVKKSLKTIMKQYYQAYKSYIDYRQRNKESGSATFMTNFEDLVIKWADGQLKK